MMGLAVAAAVITGFGLAVWAIQGRQTAAVA